MLKELEALGKSGGVDVAGLRPNFRKQDNGFSAEKKGIDTKPYQPLDLEFKGKAEYQNLLKFLAALNSFPKILEVRTISITPPSGGVRKADDRLDFTIGLRAFLF
jgi:hypothetical protein